MKTVAIDHVTVVTPDASQASATFERLFGLPRVSDPSPAAATALAIGGARVEFVTPADGTPLAEALRTGGEGMAALTLTIADLDEAAATLARAGVAFAEGVDAGRRVLAIDPSAAHGVRLTLVGRR